MSVLPADPRDAALELIALANREPISVVRSVVRRYGTADTLTIRDEVRRALADDDITEAQVHRILAAERESRRLCRGAA